MKKVFSLRVLFKFLLITGSIKILLGLFYFLSETTFVSAKEGSPLYTCPPEISDFLNLEKERLLQKEKELESKERELKLLEKRIEEEMNALTQLSQEVEEKLNRISAIQDERIKLLVKAYAEMSPSKAAQQIVNMDREMAVKILSQLKSNQIASILSAMPPDKAAAIAEALSGYPPKEY
ncbi:MAG: MotE family protein [Caldimicrobium sp.]